jgi:hypothetical protein
LNSIIKLDQKPRQLEHEFFFKVGIGGVKNGGTEWIYLGIDHVNFLIEIVNQGMSSI